MNYNLYIFRNGKQFSMFKTNNRKMALKKMAKIFKKYR